MVTRYGVSLPRINWILKSSLKILMEICPELSYHNITNCVTAGKRYAESNDTNS